MASIYFCSSKQFVRPPQRGIFPLRRSRYWMQAIHHTWRYSCIVTFRFDVSFHIIIIHTHAFSSLIVFWVEQKVFLECLAKGEKQQQRIFKRIPPMSDGFSAGGKGGSQWGAFLLCEYYTVYIDYNTFESKRMELALRVQYCTYSYTT